MERECMGCQAQSGSDDEGDVWAPGETCLFGTLFFCSFPCAEVWANENAKDAAKPGHPEFFADVTPWPDCPGCIDLDSEGELVVGVECPAHGPIGRHGGARGAAR